MKKEHMQEIIDSQKEIINSKNKEIDILKNKIKVE